jgi:hypothetical protein
MKPPLPPLTIVAAMVVVFLGAIFGLYALLTAGRRRMMREIRTGASARGWRFRLRHWVGDPTSFRIDGRTNSGLDWILKTVGAGSETSRPPWNVRLAVRFPTVGGKVDFVILPREAGDRRAGLVVSGVSAAAQAKVAAFSPALGSAIDFFHAATDVPSGLPDFDAAYQVLGLSQQFGQPLIADLAVRILHWPEDTIVPHSVLVWRDPFGLHLQVRLPAPANWPTVCYAVGLAEELATRLPAAEMPSAPPSLVDRLIARFEK